MLFDTLNSISASSFVNQFVDYTLLTAAFFSFFVLVNNLIQAKKEVKVNNNYGSTLVGSK